MLRTPRRARPEEVLGFPPGWAARCRADVDEARRRYLRLAKSLHPDKWRERGSPAGKGEARGAEPRARTRQDTEEAFKRVSEAFQAIEKAAVL